MWYPNAKVYHNGSHFIGIPHTTNRCKKRPKPQEKVFVVSEDENGEEVSIAAMDKDEIQKMMNEYMANGGQFKYKKDPKDETKYLQNEYENYSPALLSILRSADAAAVWFHLCTDM